MKHNNNYSKYNKKEEAKNRISKYLLAIGNDEMLAY